jgi:hypothetical protein
LKTKNLSVKIKNDTKRNIIMFIKGSTPFRAKDIKNTARIVA